ncbi:MAG: thermonuclease family protein [Proteobacteria bacterium]|nr:thermonuclease family protein [Pseudomonadota bacterium]MBI3497948.1 thermonuclease family protein [Pseudomonadota bacterium]
MRILAAPLAALLWLASPPAAAEPLIGGATALSGDMILIGGKRLALAGIIAPAREQKCIAGALPWLCGTAAVQHLVGLLKGRILTCEDHGNDSRGRPSVLCKTGDGRDISEQMVRAGWAVAGPEASEAYKNAEVAARGTHQGMWSRTPQ